MSIIENILNAKQKRFCEEYVIDFNQTQAAIRAGYSKKTARQQGSKLLTKGNIIQYVDELKAGILKRSKMTVDECVQRLTAMARFDILDLYDENGAFKDLKDIPEDTRMAIESIDSDDIKMGDTKIGETKKLKLSSRRENIKELMKYLGGYEKDNTQKVQPFMNKVQMVIKERKLKE